MIIRQISAQPWRFWPNFEKIIPYVIFLFMKLFFHDFFLNHDISDWNLMFRTIFPTMTFLKKKWHFQKKKVMVVKNHINWKSDKCSSTMTLRKKNVMADKNEKLVTIWQILAQTWRFWPNVGKIIRYVIFCSWN